ncbi:hypothetical protein F3Y22_tig00111835pilonHSYRG00063 [Hibiscus syriacus]|uniref:Uncharacterized protein n=1 Tax=Hibiscus syriacus TaxID=106335 RepID=A0A6A2XS13_HIBSY|nr:hypothetical protein F3Y22_tig00111835pilonHSYRG00063 [Hibiscus syriacus]
MTLAIEDGANDVSMIQMSDVVVGISGQEGLFWLCLLAIIVAALIPRFVVNFLYQLYVPSDAQIEREIEKFRTRTESGAVGREMNSFLDAPRR